MSKSMIRNLPLFRSLGLASMVLGALPLAALAQTLTVQPSGDTPFSSMAVTQDEADACLAPRPPHDLGPTAYVRNGYRAILRIIAAEKWKKTQSCECYLNQTPWEKVVERSEGFKVSDNTGLPFDVAKLRLMADDILAARDKACE